MNCLQSWSKVIPIEELNNIVSILNSLLGRGISICPTLDKLYKPFEMLHYNDCKVVFVGQDPYPQKGVATGLAFANDHSIKSPSLKCLYEGCTDAVDSMGIRVFDPTLESWVKQGVLLLNYALTCEENKPGSHILLWKPFIEKFISNLSYHNPNLVYVLLGNNAKSLKSLINSEYIIEEDHPVFYLRKNEFFPSKIFTETNKILTLQYGNSIEWYKEF